MALLDGGLLDMGSSALSDLGKPASGDSDVNTSYRKPLGVGQFDNFGASSLVQGETRELARLQVAAGLALRWGFGSAEYEANQGYAYGKLNNSNGEQIHGVLTFKWENATGRESQVVEEVDSNDISTPNRYDRDQQRPFPEQTDKNRAMQDQFLVVEFTPTTDPADITNSYAVDAGSSDVRIPTTEYEVA